MEHSINTYRIRYLKDTSLQTAYVQGKDQEEATKEFFKIFINIHAEKVLSVENIQETKEEYDISKIIKIATSIFIALIGVYGIYFGWNSYNQMSSNEEQINTFSIEKKSEPKSERGMSLINFNSFFSSEKKDQHQGRLQELNSIQPANSERQELKGIRAEKAKKFVLEDKTLCSSSDVVVLSCNIKQKILSVCQQKNNKFVYKYGKPHKVELTISSKPLYSHNQFVRANVESRLRFHNKGYDYIVYSNNLFTYDKHPNDGTGVYKAGHGVYVLKNNKLLADLKCNKTYPYMEDIYKLRNSFRHEKYSFLGRKDSINSNSNYSPKQKDRQQTQSHISTTNQLTDAERQELEQLRAEKAEAARKKEANSELVGQSQTIHSNNFQNTRVDIHTDGSETYYARISQRDHYGARNQKLKDVGTILQQDRANYHKYHKRDREDTGDNRFDTRDNRNKIKRMLARGSTSKKTLDAVRHGTPLVKVRIYKEHIDVTLESKGGQTHQRQHRKILPQRTTVPVMIGGDPDLDACGATGMIRGISRHGDGFLAVRSGPGAKYKMIDKFYRNGVKVTMCDGKGKWVGIVYGKDCGEAYDNIAKRKPYEGSCKSGWIFNKYIKLIAG